jgi:hypothetical protein
MEADCQGSQDPARAVAPGRRRRIIDCMCVNSGQSALNQSTVKCGKKGCFDCRNGVASVECIQYVIRRQV